MARILLSITLTIICIVNIIAQNNVGIGTTTPDESAKLEINSTTQGVLLSRVSSDKRNAIANPALGLLVYDTDKRTLYMFDGQKWLPFAYATNTIGLPPTERVFDDAGITAMGFRVAINELGIVISNNSGKVYFLSYDEGSYSDYTEIISSSSNPAQAKFGNDLALNGNVLAVGVPGGASDTGKVYTFKMINGVWQQQQILKQNQPIADDGFGFSVALSENHLIVGAPFDNIFGSSNEGSFFIFNRINDLFSLQNKVFQPGGSGFAPNDYFGYDVDIDGVLIIVGAPGHSSREGKAYYYTLNGGSITLDFQQPYSTVSIPDSYYGYSVAIDSSAAIIGMPGINNRAGGYHIKGNFGALQYGDEALEFEQYFISAESGSSSLQNRYYGAEVSISNKYYAVSRPNKINSLFSSLKNGIKKSNVEIYDYNLFVGDISIDLLQTWESESFGEKGMGISTSIWNGRVCAGHDEANKFLIKDFRPF